MLAGMGANPHGLSNALGWISIACWIIVYSPQIVENYTLQSGEGLSVVFVVTWLLGDLCNLVGALMAGLQATVIILAVYYSLCDITLLSQIYYYRNKYPDGTPRLLTTPAVTVQNEAGEDQPLLNETDGRREKQARESLGKTILKYIAALVFVCAVGALAWALTGGATDGEEDGKEKDMIEWRSQVMGWLSAVLYLGSRIPQIMKNMKTECEGLSLALFLFAIAGNVTYVLSICSESVSSKHLVANASWLVGSGGTVVLDLIVLCQFLYFRQRVHR